MKNQQHGGRILALLIAAFWLSGCSGAAESAVVGTEPTAIVAAVTAVPIPALPTATVAEVLPTSSPSPLPSPLPPTETAATPEQVPTPPETAEETAGDPLSGESLEIEAADGLSIKATLYVPPSGPAPGVILLHMLGSNRQVWSDVGLVEKLTDEGYAVLTVDLRGHGETGGAREWALAADDLLLVWETFTSRDDVAGEQTAIIGASIGANLALATANSLPEIDTAVLLSPGLDYRGVTTDDKLIAYGQRPLLVVASEEDTYAAQSSQTLAEKAGGETQLEIYQGAGHGTNMFNTEDGLTRLILSWLAEHTAE